MDGLELFLTEQTGGTGLARLARLSAHLTMSDSSIETWQRATRIALEQLFQRDKNVHRDAVAFAVDELTRARARLKLSVTDALVIDLIRAACLARLGDSAEAERLVLACRERMQPMLTKRWQLANALARANDIRARWRADLLREETVAIDEQLSVIAAEIAALARGTVPSKTPASARTIEQQPKRVVLVVDDDEDVRDALSLMLEAEGYQVLTASDGAQARALIEEGLQASAIILDLMIPVMNGWDFREWQRTAEAGRVPTIVFSALTLRPGALGDATVMAKGADACALLAAVSHACRPGA